jgi:predicted O-methyltransferase YrrM
MLQPVVDYWLATDRFEKIQGFLDPIEGYALMLMAAYGPGRGAVVEIGSLYGKSTCYLAEGSRKAGRGPIHAVDTFAGSAEHQAGQPGEQKELLNEKTTFKAFLRNLASMRLDDWVKPQVGTSTAIGVVWDQPIRLLFIDGDHSYEGSKQDFDTWSSHVSPNGLVAFHDVGTWEGVTQFYAELMGRASGFKETLAVATLRVAQRVG